MPGAAQARVGGFIAGIVEAEPVDQRLVGGQTEQARARISRLGPWRQRADLDKAEAEIEQRIRKFASPMRGAERYDVEEIIDPRHTRKLLCEFAELAAPLRTPGRSSFGVRP